MGWIRDLFRGKQPPPTPATPPRGAPTPVASPPADPKDVVTIGGGSDEPSNKLIPQPGVKGDGNAMTPAGLPGAAAANGAKTPTETAEEKQKALEQEKALQDRLHIIETVGRGVSGDYKLRLRSGEAWAYDFGENEIIYRKDDLKGKSEDYAIGVILQETGRRMYSRRPSSPEFKDNPALDFLNNAVEGPRVNNLQISRFAGAKDFFKKVYDEDLLNKTEESIRDEMEAQLVKHADLTPEKAREAVMKMKSPVPRHMQFALGLIYDWYTDGSAEPDWLRDKNAIRALKGCRKDYQEAYALQREIFEKDLTPKEIIQQSKKSEEIVVTKLWPVYKKLLEMDEKDLGQSVFGNGGGAGQGKGQGKTGQGQGQGQGQGKTGQSQGQSQQAGQGQGQGKTQQKSPSGGQGQGQSNGQKADKSQQGGGGGQGQKADGDKQQGKGGAGGGQGADEKQDKQDGAGGGQGADKSKEKQKGAGGGQGAEDKQDADQQDGAGQGEGADQKKDKAEQGEGKPGKSGEEQGEEKAGEGGQGNGSGNAAGAETRDEADEAPSGEVHEVDPVKQDKNGALSEVPDPMPTDTSDGGQLDDSGLTDEQRAKIKRIYQEMDKAFDKKVQSREERDRSEGRSNRDTSQNVGGVGQAENGGKPGNGKSTVRIDLPTLQELLKQKAETEQKVRDMRSPYEKYFVELAPDVDDMAGELKNILKENSDMKFIGDFDNGKKLNMRRAMQSAAKYDRTGEYDQDIWLRRNDPKSRDYDFVFVVDESGSMMCDERWDNTLKALVMGAEALQSLNINFAVVGYSDYAIIHKGFEDKYDVPFREQMLNQVHNSLHSNNNEEAALDATIKICQQRPADKQKIVIFITDGGTNRSQVEGGLAQMNRLGIKCIGVGIGPGMAEVQQIFPDHVLASNIKKFPWVLTDRIREEIVGGIASDK